MYRVGAKRKKPAPSNPENQKRAKLFGQQRRNVLTSSMHRMMRPPLLYDFPFCFFHCIADWPIVFLPCLDKSIQIANSKRYSILDFVSFFLAFPGFLASYGRKKLG